jgi:N-acetylmuramoyl-L-alanine amidase
MRTVIVIALLLVVGGLAAFNFSDLSRGADRSDKVRDSVGAPDLPRSDGPAESALADADATAPVDGATAAPNEESTRAAGEAGLRSAESAAPPTADESAAPAEGPESASGTLPGGRASSERSERNGIAAQADGASGRAAARGNDDDRRRRSRWYRRPEPDLSGWTRPAGPPRIALQAGHWKAAEAPDEQAGLRTNGTRGGGKAEWEVNLAIARRTAELLEAQGFTVEVLPTTIPPNYWADVFVSIHADGNNSTSVSGYRAASPGRDRTGRAATLAELLTRSYGQATGLPHYPTITRRMRSYYAFNYRRYEHSLHPMTVGAILETGFLTNARDRRIIVDSPDRAARGIAEAVTQFLTPPPTP